MWSSQKRLCVYGYIHFLPFTLINGFVYIYSEIDICTVYIKLSSVIFMSLPKSVGWKMFLFLYLDFSVKNVSSHKFICWLKNTLGRKKKGSHSFHFLCSWKTGLCTLCSKIKKKKQKLIHSNKIHRHFSDLPNKCAIPDKWEMCTVYWKAS